MRAPHLSLPVLVGVVVVAALALVHSGEIRKRASGGLGQGMPVREAELARGFVLGEDERIDAKTKEDFRRSGLSHLLAVSGQNVTLLALLAMPLLGALGIPLRERLLWVLALIAVYVPVAGAGPSIQRAAVMGAAGLLATLGGRRSSRLYALALAALVTLAVAPNVAADIGWQLSFAAVLGILLLAAPVGRALLTPTGSGSWRRAFAEGVGATVAATVATAPLIAFHFEELSTTGLLANVLAMPAVAPAMWLGMLTAFGAQVPGMPLEVLNGLDALLLAYVAQVATWCGGPSWAQLQVHLSGLGLAVSYLGLVGLVLLLRVRPRAARALAFAICALLLVPGAVLLLPSSAGESLPPPRYGMRVVVLDVGQGDAILLQPARAPALLIDGGPPGDGLGHKLEEAGVDTLGAAVITHDQSDHAGGIEELIGRFPIARLLYGRLSRSAITSASEAGLATRPIAAGSEIRAGALSLRVLWPPAELLSGAALGQDPNRLALVIEARWHRFSMLLTADAEAEAVPLEPGPVDVLKVAHHGSEDAGLGALLDSAQPQLAVISVGEGNPYGHPAPATLRMLARHRVAVARTDVDGPVVLDINRRSFSLDG